jgi:hypothetical protein
MDHTPIHGTTADADKKLSKKAYEKPDYRYERVFETMAQSCTKTPTTGSSCASNRKVS